jgi:competence protein ComEA
VDLRDRLDRLSRAELAGLIVVVFVTLAGVGLWYTRSLPRPVQVTQTRSSFAVSPTDPPATSPVAAASGSFPVVAASGSVSPTPDPSAGAAEVVVDVAGMVRRPGVYRFPAGARVVDAVRRAGGARPGADLSLLNLAAPLVDGTQILVTKQGAPAPAGGSVTAPGGAGGLVNINTATETELESLSGVGPVTANAIIQYRTEHGPFRSVDDIVNVSGIGPVTLEDLRPFITV